MNDQISVAYRAMRRADWIDKTNHRVSPGAFLRRVANPEKGTPAEECLSFDVKSHVSCHNSLSKCHGVAELSVDSLTEGDLASIDLTLTIDDYPHACLSGMPLASEDRTMAERCASLLAKASTLKLPLEYLPTL